MTQSRWSAFHRDRMIHCPCGHHIPDYFSVTEAGFVECRKWVKDEKRECGRWVFIYSIRGGGNIVVEVTKTERDEVRKFSTPAEMIDYLGIFKEEAA